MKTDKFDESIRRKLESVDPPITDGEIDTIHRLVRGVKGAAISMVVAVKYALVALIGIVATAIVIWNTDSHTEEKMVLEQRIDSLQQQLATKPSTNNVDSVSYSQLAPNHSAETKPLIVDK